MQYQKSGILALSLTAGLLVSNSLHAEIKRMTMAGGDITRVQVSDDTWQPEQFLEGLIIPARYSPNSNIVLDGFDNEAAWMDAEEVTVTLSYGAVTSAQVKALYTDKDVVLRIRWADSSEDRLHHPWVWNAESGAYEVGPQMEDSLMISLEAGCEWFPSFLAGYEFDFDAWHWMAGRTDPLGHALDLAGSVKGQQLSDTVHYTARNSVDEWNLKFTDRNDDILHKTWEQLDRKYEIWPATDSLHYHDWLDGGRDRQFTRVVTPPENMSSNPAPTLPQFEALPLQNGADDVYAKGNWKDGFWTVELRRNRLTPGGHTWDHQFERLSQFSLHIFDKTDRLDQSSESKRLFMQFLPPEQVLANQ